MLKCDGCCMWLDLQDDAVMLDEGTLCQSCFTEWYGEDEIKNMPEYQITGKFWKSQTVIMFD